VNDKQNFEQNESKLPMNSGAIKSDSRDSVTGDDCDSLLGVAAFVPRVGPFERKPGVDLLHHMQQRLRRI
jgi:hypothetical protein